MSTSAPEGTPPAGQGQQPPEPTPPAPPAAPLPAAAAGTGPWAADLEALFADPNTRAQVDQFLRDKVQPHTTRLEQQVAATRDAQQLWEQLNSSPIDTYVALTTEMFGEEAGQRLLSDLQQQQAEIEAGEKPTVTPSIDPRVEAAVQYYEQNQQNQYYNAELARVTTESGRNDIDPEMLHPFVAAADGNFEMAVQLYDQWLSKLTPAEAAAVTEETTPPPAMGSDTAAAQSSSAPLQPRQESLHDAIDSWAAEQRANREAPPIAG